LPTSENNSSELQKNNEPNESKSTCEVSANDKKLESSVIFSLSNTSLTNLAANKEQIEHMEVDNVDASQNSKRKHTNSVKE
jgi:DNA-binding IscR family transcriptional regulator